MFLLVSCSQRGFASVHAGMPPPPGRKHPPWEGSTPQEGSTPSGKEAPPLHTVNEWPVCILLECILVWQFFQSSILIQDCIPVGCILPTCWPCTGQGGVCSRGVWSQGHVCVCSGGVAWSWGWYPSMHWGRPPYPPYEQNSWHMVLKISPCPKLRLRVVIRNNNTQLYITVRRIKIWIKCF